MRPLVAGLLAIGAVATATVPAHAGNPPTPAEWAASNAAALAQAQGDLAGAHAAYARLSDELAAAEQEAQSAKQRAIDDQQKEASLKTQISRMARSSYEVQGSQLAAILDARSIGELWTALAQARLVADRQTSLLRKLDNLRRADEAARDQAVRHRDSVSYTRSQVDMQIRTLEGQLPGLALAVQLSGQVMRSPAGQVPGARLPQTGGVAGQCTWYAEQAWVTYSDPGSPKLYGDGSDVVSNLSQELGRPYTLEPTPGALVSWKRPLLSEWGHVAYVAAVDRDGNGTLTGYTVWEMNWLGAFIADTRHIRWAGPNDQIQFMSPPNPVDPFGSEAARYGPR